MNTTTNSIIKKYDNITITVKTHETIDYEMMNLIKNYQDSTAYLENTKAVYQPKIDAVAFTKAEAIQKQINSLGDLAMQTGLYARPLIAHYINNKSGQQETFRIVIPNSTKLPINNYRIIINDCSYDSMMEYTMVPSAKEGDSPLVSWEEYCIYNNLRLFLMNRIKEKIDRNREAGNHIIDQYNDIIGN